MNGLRVVRQCWGAVMWDVVKFSSRCQLLTQEEMVNSEGSHFDRIGIQGRDRGYQVGVDNADVADSQSGKCRF